MQALSIVFVVLILLSVLGGGFAHALSMGF